MSNADAELSRLFAGTINTLQTTRERSSQCSARNGPPVFGKFANVIQDFFTKCSRYHGQAMIGRNLSQEVIPTMKICESNAARLNETLRTAISCSNAEGQYRTAANQMIDILNHAIQIAHNTHFTRAVGSQVHELRQVLGEMKNTATSFDSRSTNAITNSGTGAVNFNSGTGSQFNNNGGGAQFNGSIDGFTFSP
ncbi:hypothetical protein N7457_001115 [Penicillium paradoxum]|uniref:uncharacterized protein n=1 Tax=Penicillium paradoxum TaxID=176176 RepID=UPI0025496F46|nr:uncharacterized protein N7457_001115 [Penicillium paradoxum]KAJ5794516.1 hypothetical protein N7457_001115 [Penicillium paradoxum]